MTAPLPQWARDTVGCRLPWSEDRPVVVDGEASLARQSGNVLVIGARWARNVDNKPVGQEQGLVQFLVEREDGTSRWSGPQYGEV